MKVIEDGNLTWWFSVVLIVIGVAIMLVSFEYAPPSRWSVIPVLFGFGVAAVGGMCCRARMLHIKPFDNSYKNARKSYELKDNKRDKP